jgi:hypothetical protein
MLDTIFTLIASLFFILHVTRSRLWLGAVLFLSFSLLVVFAVQVIAKFLSLMYSYLNISMDKDIVPDEIKGRPIHISFPLNLFVVSRSVNAKFLSSLLFLGKILKSLQNEFGFCWLTAKLDYEPLLCQITLLISALSFPFLKKFTFVLMNLVKQDSEPVFYYKSFCQNLYQIVHFR